MLTSTSHLGMFYMPWSYDMGPTALLPLLRKACWGFFPPKNPTASAGCEHANLSTEGQHATSRPPRLLLDNTIVPGVSHVRRIISVLSTWRPEFDPRFPSVGIMLVKFHCNRALFETPVFPCHVIPQMLHTQILFIYSWCYIIFATNSVLQWWLMYNYLYNRV
jgi:hypothetical protein